jgi:hypothetical protein
MKIKAHKTIYGGTIFRSRLEATWAAFFDAAGLSWAYEPIDLDGWVPDFALWLNEPVYVEVKPAPLSTSLPHLPSAVLCSDFPGFEKAKSHWKSVNVLLLGLRPNDDADYFGIGSLLDGPAAMQSWYELHDRLRVKDAKAKWGAAQAATQWVPA